MVWYLFPIFSNVGHWGYSYRTHQRLASNGLVSNGEKTARDLLNERYASGAINREEFTRMKAELAAA
ncbi:MAG: SHOCT domain-containing protein [Oleibacter sp.]|nr:SHOCT domain-containing protein [Thalassolituus sp.]